VKSLVASEASRIGLLVVGATLGKLLETERVDIHGGFHTTGSRKRSQGFPPEFPDLLRRVGSQLEVMAVVVLEF